MMSLPRGVGSSLAGGWQPGRHTTVLSASEPSICAGNRARRCANSTPARRGPGRPAGATMGIMFTRPEPGAIPDKPGSYQFLDHEGRVIYVGKAKSLRSRLSNYFG